MKKFFMFIAVMFTITLMFAKEKLMQIEQREFADGLGILTIHKVKGTDFSSIDIIPNFENFNKLYNQYSVVTIIFTNLDETKLFEKCILTSLETFCNSNDWNYLQVVEDLSPEEKFLNIGDLLANTAFMYPIFHLLAPELDQTKFELDEIEDISDEFEDIELVDGMTLKQYWFFYGF